MLPLILLVLFLIFLNYEIFENTSCSKEPFTTGHIPPFNEDEYNLHNPDMEYYFDNTGRKGTLFNISKPPSVEDLILKKKPEKFSYFNAIVDKLEIYPEDVYNDCNPLPPMI